MGAPDPQSLKDKIKVSVMTHGRVFIGHNIEAFMKVEPTGAATDVAQGRSKSLR